MRIALACLLVAAAPALAQVPEMKGVPAKDACADCGVVRSVRPTHTETAPSPSNDAKPSGLVATVPLGRTDEKARVGPSQRVGKDVVTKTDSWEVTILLSNARSVRRGIARVPGTCRGSTAAWRFPTGKIRRANGNSRE